MTRHGASSIAFLAMALSACTTASAVHSNPIEARWAGRSAGEFFAKHSPPVGDNDDGSNRVYNWRGGYNRIKQQNGKTVDVSCSAKITVSSDYKIRDIKIVSDRPGENSSSYCTELLSEL